MSSFQEGLMSRRMRFWLGVMLTGSSYLRGRADTHDANVMQGKLDAGQT